MDEQDNDFKELWANILGMPKKKAGATEATKRVQKWTKTTTTRSKLRGKAVSRSQIDHCFPVVKGKDLPQNLGPKVLIGVHEDDDDAMACSSGETSQEDRRSPFSDSQLGTVASDSAKRNLTVSAPSGYSQTTLSFRPATQPETCSSDILKTPLLSGSKVRTAELVVERMQQFKRVAPEQLKHSLGDSLPKAAADRNFSDKDEEEDSEKVIPDLLPTEEDGALAFALQQKITEEVPESLEEEGLFFCQICQKDLSAMNTTRRGQHINRCLDEMEAAQISSSSKEAIPDCPICGKHFQTSQSRTTHLKRCSVKMDVPPKLLLQALHVPLGLASLKYPSNQPNVSKRKGISKDDSREKKKKAKLETKDEDLQVALAMSRSLLEQEKREQAALVPNVKPVATLPIKWKPGSEKKTRKRGPTAPPPLLLQDPEKARKRTEERVAMLLTQEVEFPPTPRLPPSRILENGSGKTDWLMPLPRNKDCFLWNSSALAGPCDPELFYTAELTPPIVPCKSVQNCKSETVLSSLGSVQPEISQQLQPDISPHDPASTETADEASSGSEGAGHFSSQSQKDVQTLQDLVELAREGQTLTQWSHDVNYTQEAEQPRKELTSTDTSLSGFVPPSKEKRFLRSNDINSSLKMLASDFSIMVNNPHLSDVQFQVDSGEILYAHMFVLYARCPLAIELVYKEGFYVNEDGDEQTRRVLLSDVTEEAAHAFLRYLYTADADIPARILPQLRALATRFDLKELVGKCEECPGESQMSSGGDLEDDLISVRDDEDNDNRKGTFQEFLNSLLMGENEEEEAGLNPACQMVDENEMDEQELQQIYEFAATQRKMIQGELERSEDKDYNMGSDSEVAQSVKEQIKKEEAEGSVSSLTSDDFKHLREDNDMETPKSDLSEEENMQNTSGCKNVNATNIDFEPCQFEPQKWLRRWESGKDFKMSEASHKVGEGDHLQEQQFSSLHSDTNRDENYKRLFSTNQREYCEPSPIKEVIQESGKAVSGKHIDVNDLLAYTKSQKDLSAHRDGFCGSPPPKSYMSFFLALGASPVSPESNRKFPREAKTPEGNQKSFLSPKIAFQKASEQDITSGNGNGESTISQEEFSCTDLNKHKYASVLLAPVIRTQDAAFQERKEADIIILSSGDEMELEQERKSPESGSLVKEMEICKQLRSASIEHEPEIPKPEHNSPSVHGIQLRSSPVSCLITGASHTNNDVKMSRELPLSSQAGVCIDSKQSLNLSHEEWQSHEESSSVDSSWLVPDTPLQTKSRDLSAQTQVTSVNCKKKSRSKLGTKSLVVGNSDHEMAVSLIKAPEPSWSDKQLPKENSADERNPSSSRATESPSTDTSLASLADSDLSLCYTNMERKCAKSSPVSKPVSLCHEQVLEDETDTNVVEIKDSESEEQTSRLSLSSSVLLHDEPPMPVDDCWHAECLSLPRGNSQNSSLAGYASASPASSPRSDSWPAQCESPVQAQGIKGSTPLRGSPSDRATALPHLEKSPVEAQSPEGNRESFLSTRFWEDFDNEDEFPEMLPVPQKVSASADARQTDLVKTPEPACQERDKSPETPMTPMPDYSLMETPELKKELSRFGVRPLPKRQMVLKLKEIFQYTHQDVDMDMDADIEDDIPSSQFPLQKPPAKRPRQTKTKEDTGGKRAKTSKNVRKKQQVVRASSALAEQDAGGEDLVIPPATGHAAAKKRTGRTYQPRGTKEQKTSTVSPERGSLVADEEKLMLSSSQESSYSSLDGSDISIGIQSSFVVISDEEEEELPASQAAARDADTLEAVRNYILSNSALYHKILFYEPIELAALHLELKGNGIKISKAKLLDFLDAQCITFTTAAERKEKEAKRKRNKKQRKRY
ncbi:structure-specific endonuclease subunit SLX4 [Eudromia elegans]